MAVQIAELTMPRGKRGTGSTPAGVKPAVVYAEVQPWLKHAVEDEVTLERRSSNPEASLTSFTAEALLVLVNQRRQGRGELPIEAPAPEQ